MAPRDPTGYPWPTTLQHGAIGPFGFVAASLADEQSGRTPVLAVGSNASPQVLFDKMRSVLEGPAELRSVIIEIHPVQGLRVGHSGHVSIGGYVAAAPYRCDDAQQSTYSVGWFTPEQLATLDATEPNYDRHPLPEELAPVAGAQVYVSKHSVLGDNGVALPLRSQPEVHAWLRERLTCLANSADQRQWYADPELREKVRRELQQRNLIVPCGLN